ncbi:MAG: 4Fe-4S dicluster domain-containing protein [Bacillota bacterium]|nr:4Fe-4S dicluster domain-containing protein [Bacillota bacterium]
MLANYGYNDGSGDFFITIDTDKCMECEDKPCVAACPVEILESFTDDYDDHVVGVVEKHRNKIRYSCAPCKHASEERNIACQKACPFEAIKHSW